MEEKSVTHRAVEDAVENVCERFTLGEGVNSHMVIIGIGKGDLRLDFWTFGSFLWQNFCGRLSRRL